jgi:hypothetical protein
MIYWSKRQEPGQDLTLILVIRFRIQQFHVLYILHKFMTLSTNMISDWIYGMTNMTSGAESAYP